MYVPTAAHKVPLYEQIIMSVNSKRPSGRACNELRNICFERHYTRYGEGSVLSSFGNTKVICTVSIDDRVPMFLRGKKQGWLTAEYSMLPRATSERTIRESISGKLRGRTYEVQRMIGRSLRACLDMKAFGERTILIDCDVIQADGGTRVAAVCGAYVALCDAIAYMLEHQKIAENPMHSMVAAVSVGIYKGMQVLDLDYKEDANAETDMNLVMNEAGHFIEIQGTAEGHALRPDELPELLDLGWLGIQKILELQRRSLSS